MHFDLDRCFYCRTADSSSTAGEARNSTSSMTPCSLGVECFKDLEERISMWSEVVMGVLRRKMLQLPRQQLVNANNTVLEKYNATIR